MPVGKLNKRSFQVYRLIMIGQFWQILSTLKHYWCRWDMWYGGLQTPFNEWCSVQICDKQHTNRFSPMQVEGLRKEQKDSIKLWSMEDVFAIFPNGFAKNSMCQLFPWVMSLISGKAADVSTIMVVCLALVTIMKDQVKQLNKIRVAATAICIDEEAIKNKRVRHCV